MFDSTDTRFRITADQAVCAIGTVHSRAWDRVRRAKVRILGGPSEHVIECARPEDLEVIANVMLRLANLMRDPNDTRCDNIHTFILAQEGSAEVSAAR